MSAAAYDWLRALHIISVIAWMAGIFYLPRLFVYHTQVPAGGAQSDLFKVMERKLYNFIMTPAMIASAVFGTILVYSFGTAALTMYWLLAKLVLVAGLIVFHLMLGRWGRAFAEDRNRHSERFFRMVNEVPTLLMIGIVILAIVEPF